MLGPESAQAFVEERTLAGIRAAQSQFAVAGQMSRLARYHGDKAGWVLAAWTNTWLDPSFASWTLDSMLVRTRCPVLAMHGDRDEFGSPAHLERITSLVGGPSTGVLLEACGHVPHREMRGRVIDVVTRFLGKT